MEESHSPKASSHSAGDRFQSSRDKTYSSSARSPTSSSSHKRTRNSTPSNDTSSPTSPIPTVLQDGYREARHFVGSRIRHPSESTEHHSILRHSHGLVFYQGTATAIAISIFADTKLPADRTLWLKPKTSFGTSKSRATEPQQTDSMVNVTPLASISVEQINPHDERAWQRDIKQFERRTRYGSRSKHILRETDVVRIPPDAGDGYFQIMLCGGDDQGMLCISPVFRLLSLSPQMGRVGGANWATLPFEAGAMALTIQARAAIAAAVIPVKAAAKNKANPYIPSKAGKAQAAGKLAYGTTGAADKIGEQVAAFNSPYEAKRAGLFSAASKIDDDYENGPKQPYPIRFAARCDVYDEEFPERHVLSLIKLIKVPEPVTYRLSGHYFGWCSIPSSRVNKNGHRWHHWYQAVIIVSPVAIDKLERVSMSRVNAKDVYIQLLEDDRKPPAIGTDIRVEVFGSLRPWDPELEKLLAEDMEAGEDVAFETARINEMRDIEVAQTILDVPAWGANAVSRQEREAQPNPDLHGMDKLKHEYAAKRLTVQKKLDQIPLHKVGVRMPVDRMRDNAVVMNGYYVER